MDEIINNPYNQPAHHVKMYDRICPTTGTPMKARITFHNQTGMPTPWKHWDQAMFSLLADVPLEELTQKPSTDFSVFEDFTISTTDPDEEYEIITGTRFRLEVDAEHQATPVGARILTGTGSIRRASRGQTGNLYADPSQPTLDTVQVSIELMRTA